MKKKIIYITLSAIVLITAAACARTEKSAENGQETIVSVVSQIDEETISSQQSLDNLTGYYRRFAKTVDDGHIIMDFFVFEEDNRYFGYLNMMGFENTGSYAGSYPQAVLLMELSETQGGIEARCIENLTEEKQEEYWGTFQEGNLLFSAAVEEDTLSPTWGTIAICEQEESKGNAFVREENYLSVMLSGERDKDVFLRVIGISKEDVPIYRYGREDMPLLVYYDEQTGKGLGLYYTEDYIIGFDIPECEQKEWQDTRYDVTKDGRSGSETKNYQENREYDDNGRMTRFESRGIVDAAPEPCEDTLIRIEFFYREDGTLERKSCYYNSYVFGTYRGTETYYYDEKERPEYVYAYVTHGALEEFYIYEDTGDVPLYCLTVDHFGAEACTESFVRYVDEASGILKKGKSSYVGFSSYHDDEKKAKELLANYMQPGEIPDIVWSESADTIRGRDLESCVFFDGEGLNGIREAWNNNWDEKPLWISKIHIPPFFHAWVEEETIMTDYPAWLFASTLYLTMEEGVYAGKWDYCLDASMPSYSQYAIPYYSLLEEPLVFSSDFPSEEIEPVFQAVYEKMHEIQMSVDGDLSQEIRFAVNADAEWTAYAYLESQPEENFASLEEWMDTMAVEGYYTWKSMCEEYLPSHRISFYLPYDEGGAELFDVLMEDRDRYLAHMDSLKEKGKTNKYTVQDGDCLWNIAQTIYGDGALWVSLYENNREVIGENPDLIFAGTELTV